MARILVIDDDPSIVKLLERVLSRSGHSSKGVYNGKQGLDLIETEEFDLVITDILMPEKEGLETIVDLRKEYPNMKILAISGGTLRVADNYLSFAKKLGADEVLSKPLDMDKLRETIDSLVGPAT